MGGLHGYFPNLPEPKKPLRFWRSATVRVGFWIMWPGIVLPGRRLMIRLGLTDDQRS